MSHMKRAVLSVFFFFIGFVGVQMPCWADAAEPRVETFLVFGGKTGWIGQKLIDVIRKAGYVAYAAESRLENRQDVEREILQIMPDFVINAAGMTGRPNVDWCEDHQQDTIRANILGTLDLADLCFLHNIHMTQFGTGCIYEYDDTHFLGSGIGFTEEDEPNFRGSFYSYTKALLEKLLKCYPNVLNLRLRMPLSSELHSRNFITKITHYQKVVNIPNSMTVLECMLPISVEMARRHLTGVYNFTNPGTISHNEILALYKQYIDPSFTWTNFTLEEQNKILKAGRSNNELDVSKLLREFPEIPPIQEAIIDLFKAMRDNQAVAQ